MAEQFLNLEGRDTFNADNGYEKTKIVNGGIPQNSDLNEQSSIDEERSRNIIKEGFGSGKLNPTDFLMELQTGELLLLEREEEAGVLGTLWQDGHRLKLRNNGDYTIADNDTTPSHRKLKASGNFRGRVYLVHAKQDYLDPNAKLTVRDINDANLIQVDTAVREKRVTDYYIDWSTDGGLIPDRLDTNLPVTLSDTGVFAGKTESFSASPLYGFVGHLYYMGDIIQNGADQSTPQEASEMFDGQSDNVLYTGGDAAHRRDTEVCGLIFTDDETLTYTGLQPVATGDSGAVHTGIVIDGRTYQVKLPTININQTQEDAGEQLHIPSLNNYFILPTELSDRELLQNILSDDPAHTTVDLAITALMDTFNFPDHTIDTTDEGRTSDMCLLYVDAAGFAGLSNIASYRVKISAVTEAPTTGIFPLALFQLVLNAVDGDELSFKLVYGETGQSYLLDRRRYFINSVDKIADAAIQEYANTNRHIVRTTGAAGIVAEDFIRLNNNIFQCVSFDSGSQILIMDFYSGTGLPQAGQSLYHNNSGSWVLSGSVAAIIVQPEINPVVETLERDFGGNINGTTLPSHTISEVVNPTTVTAKPRSLNAALAAIKGALGQLVPLTGESDYQPITNWATLFRKGIRLQSLQTALNALQTVVWSFVAPKSPLEVSGVKIISFNLPDTGNREGSIMLVNGARTLQDSLGSVVPIISITGTSTTAANFAPIIHLRHYGNPTIDAGKWGSMIVLEGKNGLIACPYGADFRAVWNNNTGVIIDGQTGLVKATILTGASATIGSLVVSTSVSLLGETFTIQQLQKMKDVISGPLYNADNLHSHVATEGTPIATIIAGARTPVNADVYDDTLPGYGKGALVLQNHPSANYLYCNGARVLVSKANDPYSPLYNLFLAIEEEGFPFGYDSESGVEAFYLPDLRGEFLRGADDLRGTGGNESRTTPTGSTNTLFGSTQDSINKAIPSSGAHGHTTFAYANNGIGGDQNGWDGDAETSSSDTKATGAGQGDHTHAGSDTEARPRNVSIPYFIKY